MIRGIVRRLERMIHARQAYKFFIRDWVALDDLKLCAEVVGTMRFSRNLDPLCLDGPTASRITVVAPHPDDEMLGPGGTILRAINRGADVRCIYLTSGKPAGQVEEETARVADRFGYETQFLRFPLHNIPLDAQSVACFADAIQDCRPECLFLPFLFDDHDDHRRASHLLLTAHGAGLLPDKLEIWGYQVYTVLPPNVVVDITDTVDNKAAAIAMWRTQLRSRDWVHFSLGLNAFNSRFISSGPEAGYVEGFFVLPLDEYVALCATYFRNPDRVYYSATYTVRTNRNE